MSLAGHVGFGLVVIVIADEIFDGVMGEEGFEFVEELRREGLIVRENDGRAVDFLDHLGDGEGFAGAGDAEENLVAIAIVYTSDELGDRLRLVAAGIVITG